MWKLMSFLMLLNLISFQVFAQDDIDADMMESKIVATQFSSMKTMISNMKQEQERIAQTEVPDEEGRTSGVVSALGQLITISEEELKSLDVVPVNIKRYPDIVNYKYLTILGHYNEAIKIVKKKLSNFNISLL